jgi:hypothetical protein
MKHGFIPLFFRQRKFDFPLLFHFILYLNSRFLSKRILINYKAKFTLAYL